MRTARAIVVGLLVLGMACVLLAVLSYTVLVQIQTFSAPDESSSLSSLTLFVAKRMVDGEKSGVFEPFLRAREEFHESRMELEEAVWYF